MDPSPLSVVALVSAASAALVLVVYLIRRPRLDLRAKLWLVVGLGLLPALTAGTSTAAHMTRTTQRDFCGSCHVMGSHFADAGAPGSQSLAARHSRNAFFGDRSCYTCHADYGMNGYVLTKAAGLRHVYEYYLGGYSKLTLAQAEKRIHLLRPYDNGNCRHCHTTTLKDWGRVPEHGALAEQLGKNVVSCASAGCHGYAHPFTKADGGAPPPAMPAPPASGGAR